jgi:hypothetical protein
LLWNSSKSWGRIQIIEHLGKSFIELDWERWVKILLQNSWETSNPRFYFHCSIGIFYWRKLTSKSLLKLPLDCYERWF